MHMVSEGRVVSSNDIKGLENGAIVQSNGECSRRNGKTGKEEEEREKALGNRTEDLR